ncbi:MAG TPA: dockerin type I domain-containing protein, partial [Tepidisphaeraceae bacterium]|nr:dockerin type I domain-containing protein [Tepidisphaeraceae bacterium]
MMLAGAAHGADVSAPPILQIFESRWENIEKRSADIFMAGYGGLWLPPTGRADTGNDSVGYDVYDRFDLGGPGNYTLYGSEKGLKQTVAMMHRAAASVYVDLIWNHNGYSNLSTPGFATAGGYPGFALTLQSSSPGAPGYNARGIDDVDGDFHGAFETGDLDGRLAGLIDIAQEKNHRFIRSPVPGFANNLPAGNTPAFGRLANVPAESNRRFYPDRDLPGMTVWDPATNETVTIYPFNSADPMAGDPVEENATGYLMRHTQWMVQQIGVDGFRIDAAKHMPAWVLNYFDRAVYGAIRQPLLDGSVRHVFSFSEVLDGNRGLVQQYIRKDANSGSLGQVGGNRDALDYPLFFAMRDNLSSNGLANDWARIVNASQDVQDDGLANNGSQGVAFVSNHDDIGAAPYLENVAYAYTLMRPGNAVVYFNARQFGDARPFPRDGRGDALGGLYGNTITRLVEARNTHGRGNYIERWRNKELLVYERQKSAIVALSNRLDNGSDVIQDVQTSFAPGTRLVELTGNADDATVDNTGQIDNVLVVDSDGTVDLRIPRNRNAAGVEHKKGYVIYGLPTPVGTLSISNLAMTIPAEVPTASTNGTARLTPLEVVKADSFSVTLQTTPVTVGGWHDINADGDNALLRLNDGVDLNNSGGVDHTAPGTVAYGFENFTTRHSPLYGGGDGQFVQNIDATALPEGMNYLTVRAFRHSDDPDDPPVFRDFRRVLYIDRLKPDSAIDSTPSLGGNSRQVRVVNPDMTANSVHTFLNLPAALTETQILSFVNSANKAGQIDRNLFAFGYSNVPNGNNVVTVVTFEITGNYSIRRFPGLDMGTTLGAGLGDLNFSNTYTVSDVTQFETVLYGQNLSFNPAADLNADGRIDNRDLFLLRGRYTSVGAPASVIAEARNAEVRRGDLNGDHLTDATDIDTLYTSFGSTAWLYDLDADGGGADQQGLDTLVRRIFLTEYGDANLDQRVDVRDLYLLASHWQTLGSARWSAGDFTGDGLVNQADLNLLATYWQFHTPGAASATVMADLRE